MDVSLSTRAFLLCLSLLLTVNSVHPLEIPDSHHLYSAVHYFDTLHKIDDIHQRAKETSVHPGNNPKIVQFDTLGKNFNLLLRPHTKPFHPRSHVRYGNSIKAPIDVYQFHHGHVIGAESSHVIAHLTDDGVMTAIITTDDDTYYIEPSDRHFTESHDFHMISYRGSDLKLNLTSNPQGQFCGSHDDHHDDNIKSYAPFNKLNSHTPKNNNNYNTNGRLRRQAAIEASTVCPIKLVATTSFYKQFGVSNVDHTINFLLVALLQIDAIFRSTDWQIPGVTGSVSAGVRGLQIADILVHNDTNNSPAYNSNQDWTSNDLLREFARTDWGEYCLAHLFTAQAFSDSTRLGVAYTAFSTSFRAGGVCSRRTTYENEPFSGNVGASTYKGSDRFLVLAEAVVVTGHEFGHSWGSSHDPETSECSPPFGTNAGKYIMYAFAQDGQSRNNMIFSNCSRQAISFVLNTHEDECFVAPSTDRCGDYIINTGEECDPGPTRVLQGGDDCCNANCTFKMNDTNGNSYNCSDSNHNCCFGCFPRKIGVICREEEMGNINCFTNKTCDGRSITCPIEEVYVENGTACGVMGECMTSLEDPTVTSCTNFCELRSLTTCFCIGEDECLLCCSNQTVNISNTCTPFLNPSTPLPNGRFCAGGFCDGQGECVISDPDLATFLFDLLTDFSTAALVLFIEENIVGVVIFLSLVVWIPCSIGVHLFDINREKRREKIKREKEEKKEKRKKHSGSSEKMPLMDDIDSPTHAKTEFSFNEGKNPEYDKVTKHITLV